MAVNVATSSTTLLPDIQNGTLGGANVVTKVNYGPAVELLTVQFLANPGKVSTSDVLTDGGALGVQPFFTVAADSPFEIDVREGSLGGLRRGYVFITSATASTGFEVMGEGGEQK